MLKSDANVASVWVSMFGVSQVAGGLMMYGIGLANMSLANWRVMFILCGGLTVVSGVLFVVFMPREPSTAWFLKDHERKVAAARLAQDRVTRDMSDFNWGQAKEAFLDPRTWLYCAMALFITIPTPIVKVRFAHTNCNFLPCVSFGLTLA